MDYQQKETKLEQVLTIGKKIQNENKNLNDVEFKRCSIAIPFIRTRVPGNKIESESQFKSQNCIPHFYITNNTYIIVEIN